MNPGSVDTLPGGAVCGVTGGVTVRCVTGADVVREEFGGEAVGGVIGTDEASGKFLVFLNINMLKTRSAMTKQTAKQVNTERSNYRTSLSSGKVIDMLQTCFEPLVNMSVLSRKFIILKDQVSIPRVTTVRPQ